MGDRTAMVSTDGRVYDLPAGAESGIYPVVGAIGDTLYLIWGEPLPAMAGPSGRLFWPPDVAAVWFASRVGNGAWSIPTQVLRADEVGWGYANTTISEAPDGSLELVFTARTLADGWIVLARFAGRTVSVHRKQVGGGPIHSQMVRRGDTAFILLVRADTTRMRDQNSLFLMSWQSSSRTWGPLQLVQLGRNEGAVYPRLVATPDGALHAVWTQLGANLLRHKASRDGGATWSAANDLGVPGAYASAAFAIGDNAVGLLYHDIDFRGPPRAHIACWSGNWLAPRPLAGDDRLSAFSMLHPHRVAIVAMRPVPGDSTRFEEVVAFPKPD
jgi:hypothetical protein